MTTDWSLVEFSRQLLSDCECISGMKPWAEVEDMKWQEVVDVLADRGWDGARDAAWFPTHQMLRLEMVLQSLSYCSVYWSIIVVN